MRAGSGVLPGVRLGDKKYEQGLQIQGSCPPGCCKQIREPGQLRGWKMLSSSQEGGGTRAPPGTREEAGGRLLICHKTREVMGRTLQRGG